MHVCPQFACPVLHSSTSAVKPKHALSINKINLFNFFNVSLPRKAEFQSSEYSCLYYMHAECDLNDLNKISGMLRFVKSLEFYKRLL